MKEEIIIDNIWGGRAASLYFGGAGQYGASAGIDPDMPIREGTVISHGISGMIRPVSYADFSGANVNSTPFWLIDNPKNTNLYAYLYNGKVISYSSSYASETLVATLSTSKGNGAVYYNNYIYFFRNTDVDRYGPLDNSPSMTNGVWTGATLGSQTALTNTSYPQLSTGNPGEMPNHVAHVHPFDKILYFGDFKDGQGIIHSIRTTKTTDEGDTNDGSAYNVLDLPFGYKPTAIGSYGQYLVIGAIQTTNLSTYKQGNAALFFWDTFSPSYSFQIDVPDTLVSAMKNINGTLYVFSGSIFDSLSIRGYRVSAYIGGDSLSEVYHSDTGHPPYAGAVDAHEGRLIWGTQEVVEAVNEASNEYYGVVAALGSKNKALPKGVHNIVKASYAGVIDDASVTAVRGAHDDNTGRATLIAGWKCNSDYGIDKRTTTHGTNIFRTKNYNVGQPFDISEIIIPLGKALAANQTLTVTAYLDDMTTSQAFTTINNTNFPDSNKHIRLTGNLGGGISGDHNFFLEFRFSGTSFLPVCLPIRIIIDKKNA